ncbi:uncharacterized protein LOC110538076 isoform X2 [Oncorhynchus mykiss]|uniref:uncharacterized protein LOC110538076 isoform X2 n=1 Tax=Oncorhynchus mykiss TaxID=8022 RepID=UPI001877C783|nr:uncharacterized protein LOC110538076 isoform X2 [Oncorhynchus mykiss]
MMRKWSALSAAHSNPPKPLPALTNEKPPSEEKISKEVDNCHNMPPMKEPLQRLQLQRESKSQQNKVVAEPSDTRSLPGTPVLAVLPNPGEVNSGGINRRRMSTKMQANMEKMHVNSHATGHGRTQCESANPEVHLSLTGSEQTLNCITKELVGVTRPAAVDVVRKRGRPHKKAKMLHTVLQTVESSSHLSTAESKDWSETMSDRANYISYTTNCVENRDDTSLRAIETKAISLNREPSNTAVSVLDSSPKDHQPAESSPVAISPLEPKRKRGRPKGSTKKQPGKTMNTISVKQSHVTEEKMAIKKEPDEMLSEEEKRGNIGPQPEKTPVEPKHRVGRPPKKTTLVRQFALAQRKSQRKSCSITASVNSQDIPPQHQNIETERSLDYIARHVSVSLSRVDSRRGGTADMISNVKCEDIEIELGDFNSLAQSNCLMSFQCHTDTSVKVESCNTSCEGTEFKKPLKVDKSGETAGTAPRKRSRFVFGKTKYKKGKRKRFIDDRGRLQRVTSQGDPDTMSKQTDEGSGDVGEEMDCGESAWEYEGNTNDSFSNESKSTDEGFKDLPESHQNPIITDVNILETMSHESFSKSDVVQGEEFTSKKIKEERDGAGDETEYNPTSSCGLKARGRPKGRPKGTGKTCEYCGRHFDFVSVYTVHLRTHTGERPYKCIDCDQDFAQLSNLKSHVKKHNKRCRPLKCPYCKMKFSNSKELLAHCKWHSQNPNQDSESGSKTKDNRNEATHTPLVSLKERRKRGKGGILKCHICGKVFPFWSGLQVHIRMHTGEKPYICKVCGKAFSNRSSIRIHEVTHWSIKPYNCTRCGKSFTQLSSAKKHPCKGLRESNDREGRKKPFISFTCHICEERFVQRRQYKTHLKTHAGVKLFRCLFCDQLFSVMSEFEEHHQYCTKVRGEKMTSKSEFRIWKPRAPNQQRSQQPSVKSHSPVTQLVFPAAADSQPFQNLGQTSASSVSLLNCEPTPQQKSSGHQSSQTHANKAIATTLRPFQTCIIPTNNLTPLVSKLNSLDCKSDPRKYFCPRCGRLFRHTGRLRAHMLTHAHSQSYTCDCCGKTLESWKKLWLHQRIHRQKLGRFSCPKCRQGFRFVGPYKQHMLREHPEYQWIDERPNKTLQGLDQQQCLPYQCEECNASFRTLDMLFNHQLCHSSPGDHSMWIQDDCYDYSPSTHEHDVPSNMNGFDPHMNSGVTHSHQELHHTYYPSPPLQANHPRGSHLLHYFSNHSDLLHSLSPLIPVPPPMQHPGFQPGLRSYDSTQPLTSPLSPLYSQVKIIPYPNRKDGNVNRKRSRIYGNATKRAARSKEDKATMRGLDCAECGVQFPAVSQLYEHYLQHARGEV